MEEEQKDKKVEILEEEEKPEIVFPVYFPLKAIGENSDPYRQFVIDTVAAHTDTIQYEHINTRLSSGGKYLAVTVPFTAENRDQLDNIYRTLSADNRTKYLI